MYIYVSVNTLTWSVSFSYSEIPAPNRAPRCDQPRQTERRERRARSLGTVGACAGCVFDRRKLFLTGHLRGTHDAQRSHPQTT